MRVTFKTEGGLAHFPGLSEPFTIDGDELPEEEAVELKRRVEGARFFELPEEVAEVPRGAADRRRYEITVEYGERSHTTRPTDPVEDPGLRALVDYLLAKARASRKATRRRFADEDPGSGR